MAEDSRASPNVSGTTAPLRILIMRALRRYGEGAPDAVEGDLMGLFIDFANNVINDVRDHPYWTDASGNKIELDYYISNQDKRSIPDEIVVSGMAAYYALQQASQKSQILVPMYYRRMNQILFNLKFGNTEFRLQPVDKDGDDPGYKNGFRTQD